MRRRHVVVACAMLVGCSVAALDLTGKQCPCASGFVCDVARDTCVPDGTIVDGAVADVRLGDGGRTDDADASRTPLVVVSDLGSPWQTPNSIRWEWKVTGDKKAFRSYEIVVGKSAADVSTRAAGVEILGATDHPELGAFDARSGKTSGSFTVWTTTDGIAAGVTKFVQVIATDVNGTASATKIESRTTGPAPNRNKVIFDTAARSSRPGPGPDEWAFKAPAGGEPHYELTVACGGTSPCAKHGELFDLSIDMNAPTVFGGAADFATAHLTFTIEGNVAATSFASTAAIELGNGACAGGPGICRFRYTGWTQAKGDRTTVQVPLSEMRNDDGPLTLPILQAKSFLVYAFDLSGTWNDGGALRLYNARIRW